MPVDVITPSVEVLESVKYQYRFLILPVNARGSFASRCCSTVSGGSCPYLIVISQVDVLDPIGLKILKHLPVNSRDSFASRCSTVSGGSCPYWIVK